MNKYQLVLGSASPRRKELLAYTFCPFEILVSGAEEISEQVDNAEWVMDIAAVKASNVLNLAQKKYQNAFVIGADTIVIKNNQKLGKPKNKEEAVETLTKLSGEKHLVLTGVCFKTEQREIRFYQETEVEFDQISDELMKKYIDTGEPFDKAGAYGIQAYGLSFVKQIRGSYSNVVGLPVTDVLRELESFVKLDYARDNWRDAFEPNSK